MFASALDQGCVGRGGSGTFEVREERQREKQVLNLPMRKKVIIMTM